MSDIQKVQQYFEQQSDTLQKIYNGELEKHIQSQPHWKEAFGVVHRRIVCIDEGVAEEGLHIAGSGILLGEDRTFEIAKNAGVDEVTAHELCGAAALYTANNKQPADKAPENAANFSKSLAERLGVPYSVINKDQMVRPPEFHIARYALYDAAEVNSVEKLGLPPGFIISRGILNTKEALADTAIAISIAIGAHGFGNLITTENPFVLIAVGKAGDDQFSTKSLMAELKQLEKDFNHRIMIQGFTAPAR